jgi:predicted nucleotidyltransferase
MLTRKFLKATVLIRRRRVVEAASRHGFDAIWLVGSVARGTGTSQSDIDFVVVGPAAWNPIALESFAYELAALLRREVEIITQATLCNPYDESLGVNLARDAVSLTRPRRLLELDAVRSQEVS